MPGRILQKSEDFDANLVLGRITEEGKKLSKDFRWMARWNYRVPMPNAVGITYTPTEGMEFVPFIGSDTTGCWNELETMTFSGDGATMNPEIGEKEGAYVLALQAKRQVNQKEQRILVLGDADWFSNGELFLRRKNVNTENKRPLQYCFSWLTNGEFPINTERLSSPDRTIHMGLSGVLWLKIGFMAFFPLVLVVYGIIIQVKRKRK